jgi:5'-methylthioadenosine phosphorylase
MKAEIGIIGGTGFYDPKLLRNVKEIRVRTPYGSPSDSITVGELEGRRVAFLPRHGRKHTIRPTDVNFRANIFALKKLGVQRIVAPSTVGSLREDFAPGDVVFIDQFIDRTTRREQSFYTGRQVCHISVAEPMCPELRRTLIKSAAEVNVSTHNTGTYVCIEGPRFSTKAESRMHRMWGADVVGMTLVPECVLAREAEICYACIATVTDYDVWKDHPVSAGKVGETMKANIEKVKRVLTMAISNMPKERECECKNALQSALV